MCKSQNDFDRKCSSYFIDSAFYSLTSGVGCYWFLSMSLCPISYILAELDSWSCQVVVNYFQLRALRRWCIPLLTEEKIGGVQAQDSGLMTPPAPAPKKDHSPASSLDSFVHHLEPFIALWSRTWCTYLIPSLNHNMLVERSGFCPSKIKKPEPKRGSSSQSSGSPSITQ